MPSSHATHSPAKSTTPAPTDVATYPARIAELLPHFTTPVSAASRAWLEAQISGSRARDDGAAIASPTVLDAVIEATHIAQPSLLAGKVKGYGPLRYRYCLDLAVTLADKVAHFDASVVGAAGASAEKGSSLRVARDDRRDALRMLRNFTGSDDAARARLKKVRGKRWSRRVPRQRSTYLQPPIISIV